MGKEEEKELAFYMAQFNHPPTYGRARRRPPIKVSRVIFYRYVFVDGHIHICPAKVAPKKIRARACSSKGRDKKSQNGSLLLRHGRAIYPL